MKIVLVSLYFDPNAMAIRLLSSILKRDFPNDRVNIILLSHKAKPPRMDFDLETPEDLKAIQQFFAREQFDIVGISLMTNYLNRAIQLSKAIREVSGAKILWGGIHPTLCPEECACHADIVFVGEAEIALPEVIRRTKNNQPLEDMPGIWYRKDDKLMGQGHCPTCNDLNLLPLPDYDFRSHFIYLPEDRQVVPMRVEHILKSDFAFYGGTPFHRIMTARGCAHACSYCINSRYQKLLGLEKVIRKRSIDSVFNELEMVLRLGVFQRIVFIDGDLFLRSEEWLKEFATLYKERIKLPFSCNVTPIRTTAEKVCALRDAGVTGICMGAQTGSDRLNHDVYKRNISRQHVLQATDIIKKHAPQVTRVYDFLIRSPYETLNDKIETVKLLLQLPTPYVVHTYALTLFPGLPLTEQAEKDGIIRANITRSIYDYEGSKEDCEWKKALETLGNIPPMERQKLLAILEHQAVHNTDELMALLNASVPAKPCAISSPQSKSSLQGLCQKTPFSSEKKCEGISTQKTGALPRCSGMPYHIKLNEQVEQAMTNVVEKSLKMFPRLTPDDLACAIEHSRAVRHKILGRAPGDLGDKIAQYAAVLQSAREHPELPAIKCLEIGTLFGGSCLQMLGALRNESRQGRVTCIDPFDGYYSNPDDLSKVPVTTDTLIRNLHAFGFNESSHVKLRVTKSQDPSAVQGLKEKDFPVVMIDGDHSYEGVRSDWNAYNRYVADGGYLLFDDYGDSGWPDLTRAIDDICRSLSSGWSICGSLGTTLLLRRATKPGEPSLYSASPLKPDDHRYLKTLLGLEIAETHLADVLNALHREELNLTKCRAIIADRDRAIAALRKTVAERDHAIAALRETVTGRDKIIAERTQTIAQCNQTMGGLIQAHVRAQWQLLLYRDGIGTVVLFGAGKHTAWLFDTIRGVRGPHIAVILDNQAIDNQMMAGVPVMKPEKWDLQKCKTIVLSTDTFQERFIQHCRELWENSVKLINLYEGLPPGPYPKN